MRFLSVSAILLFYIFFFLRAYIVGKKIGRTIKAKDLILNLSILFAAISSALFIIQKLFTSIEEYLLFFNYSVIADVIGTFLILLGLVTSSVASIGLGNSWRVGIDRKETTLLVTNGIYSISRNPYFLSYDLVLFGLIVSSLSIFILISSVTTIVLFHLLIIKEERYLYKTHGEKYKEYKVNVRRYI